MYMCIEYCCVFIFLGATLYIYVCVCVCVYVCLSLSVSLYLYIYLLIYYNWGGGFISPQFHGPWAAGQAQKLRQLSVLQHGLAPAP
jgi:hypothetical protein